MNITVVLVAFCGDQWLPRCLSSLSAAHDKRLHLLLVDNSGNRGIEEQPLHRFDTELIRTPHAMGFAEANNYALVRASRLEEAVLFLNQDTVSTQGWITRCIELLASDLSVGAVSPVIRTYDDRAWDPNFKACLPDHVAGDLSLDTLPNFLEVVAVPAAALLIRTPVLRRTGPFDPVFGSYYEDYDLCRRVRATGRRVGFAGNSRIMHFSGSVTDSLDREMLRMRQITRNRAIHQIRSSDGRRAAVLLGQVAFDFPYRIGRGLLRTASSQPVSTTIGAYADILRLLPRLISARRDARVWQAYLDEIGWVMER